jgi:predicted amino acid-binding ACT domain protein
VAAVTRVLADAGCNLEDTSMTILRGHFAMMLVVAGPAGVGEPELRAGLDPVGGRLGLQVSGREVADEVTAAGGGGARYAAAVYGADRPGLVARHRPPQGPLLRRAGGAARPRAGGRGPAGGGPRGLHARARPDRQRGPAGHRRGPGDHPEGATRLVEADAIEARALLHELDHLDGLLFLDRVGSASTDLFRRRRYRSS